MDEEDIVDHSPGYSTDDVMISPGERPRSRRKVRRHGMNGEV